MVTEVLLAITCALSVVLAVRVATQRRALALRDAAFKRKLQAIGETVDALDHNLRNVLQVIGFSVETTTDAEQERARFDVLLEVEDAMNSANAMVRALRKQTGSGLWPAGSVERIVRLTVSLMEPSGSRVELEIAGDIRYEGPNVPAIRVLQKLLFIAVREAAAAGNGEVVVELRPDHLAVTNAVRDPVSLDRWIPSVREEADGLGWTLNHEVLAQEAGGHRVRRSLRATAR